MANSPDQANSRAPFTISEYGSKVIWCAAPVPARAAAAALRGGRADRGAR